MEREVKTGRSKTASSALRGEGAEMPVHGHK